MTLLWQDIRFALRRLAGNPGFTVAAVLTLALGIGAVSAIFSVIHGALLRPVPYEDPARLVLLNGSHRIDGGTETWGLAYLDFADWRRQAGTFAEMAAVSSQPESFNLSGTGEPERVSGEVASASYFRLLGVEPYLGRTYSPEEDKLGAPQRVAVVGYDLWKRRFGGDPKFPGRSIFLNGDRYQVVGVMAPGFKGVTDQAEVWLPVTLSGQIYTPDLIEERFIRWLAAVGRLKPGVTAAQAQADLDRISAQLEKQFPRTNEGYGISAKPLLDAWFGDLRPALLTLFGAAVFVLLIACTNVASLLLSQSARRERELAVRSALGASNRRLAGQLLVESVLLALIGCAAGLLLALWSTGWLVKASAVKLRSFIEIGLSPLVVGTIALLALLCGLVFGVLPAWNAARIRHAEALKEGGRGSTAGRRRFRRALIVAEVALALALFAGAGLMVRSFRQLRGTDLGFRSNDLLTLRVDLKGKQYTKEVQRTLTLRFLDQVRAVPGVGAVAVAGPVIPTDDWWAMDFVFENRPEDDHPILPYHAVTPGYFSTLGIPLVRGRDFTLDDTGKVPVIIVGKALADRVWPNEDPIGKHMKSPGPPGQNRPWLTVVGVAGDVAFHGLNPKLERPGPEVFLPLFQLNQQDPTFNFLVRSNGVPAESLAPAVRKAVLGVTPSLPVYDVATMDERLDRQAGGFRFLTLLMGLFAVLALGLAAVGIYGVVSYGVAQRRREIGLRLAVGARRADVLGLILRETLVLAVTGAVLGTGVAVALRRLLASRIEHVGATDWPTLALAAAVLLGVALAASFLPARSAARTDPVLTLNDSASG